MCKRENNLRGIRVKLQSSEDILLTESAIPEKKNASYRTISWIAAGAVLLCLAVLGTWELLQDRIHLERRMRFIMDTYVTIYAAGPSSLTLPAINAAFDRMEAVDAKFSISNTENPVNAFNEKGLPITDTEILEVLQAALHITLDSEGAFDITTAPIIDLWGFYGNSPRLPSKMEIDSCLMHVGFEHLSLSPRDLRKDDPDVRIDLGGIAKGYAIGQAASVLKEYGITSALIDAGGDVYALGKRGKNPWKVGIKNPRGDGILGYVEVVNMAVMGSGDYERFFEIDGKRYHHIFNPRTGYPVAGITGSVLLCRDPMMADGWNTAVFAMGMRKGLDLVSRRSDMEVLMISDAGEILASEGLKTSLHMKAERKP